MRIFRLLAIMAAAMVLTAAPASAQKMSEGFEFLKAVKDRDGDKATAALDRPGSTLVNARDLASGAGALTLAHTPSRTMLGRRSMG